MKILIFNWRDITHPWAGGAELNMHEQAKQWVKLGHEVTLLCGTYTGCEKEVYIDDIRTIRVGGRFTLYLLAIRYYLKHLKGKYDIIIDIENGIPFFTPLFCKEPCILLIHHIHRRIMLQEIPILGIIPYLMERFLMPLIYKNKKVVVVSESTKHDAEKIGLNIAAIIHNGVDLKIHTPGTKAHTPTILNIGRQMRYKRPTWLIDMLSDILKKVPEAQLIICGDGEENKAILDKIKELGLQHNVKFLGKINLKEKIKLMQQSWIFVTASEKEGWGLTTIEANACGTPTVAFNVPGLRNAIINGETGLLASNKEDFSNKCVELLRNKTLRNSMSKNALKWSKKFSWENTAGKMLHLMEATIKK